MSAVAAPSPVSLWPVSAGCSDYSGRRRQSTCHAVPRAIPPPATTAPRTNELRHRRPAPRAGAGRCHVQSETPSVHLSPPSDPAGTAGQRQQQLQYHQQQDQDQRQEQEELQEGQRWEFMWKGPNDCRELYEYWL